MNTNEMNEKLLTRLAVFLNDRSTAIDTKSMDSYCNDLGFTYEEAYRYLLAAYMDLDTEYQDKELFIRYFREMVHCLDSEEYKDNPYMQNIHLSQIRRKEWEFTEQSYQPFEAFVMDDFKYMSDGRMIPQIGFFENEFKYPCVKQKDREWMTVTPNEINTMKEPIALARGNVLTYGLGLGYYAYMASEKKETESVTIVDSDHTVIDLFKEEILPQFKYREKINVIYEDAIQYAKNSTIAYDFTFADIWHDVSDGLPLMEKLKQYEHGETRYWIQDTMKYYQSY